MKPLLTAIVMLVSTTLVHSEFGDHTLYGLGSLQVMVNVNGAQSGRLLQSIQSDVESKLREAGMSYCQKLWIGRPANPGVDGRKEESVSSG